MHKIFVILYLIIIPISASEGQYNILLVGNGGREHALAWKMAQSPLVKHIFVAPGNGGTCKENKVSNVNISTTDIPELAKFAQSNSIDLTLVGPETPLALGIVDFFNQKNLLCFGPSQAAAKIESSKIFAKEFMKRHKIPTAQYAEFSDYDAAQVYIQNHTPPFVIKADGLANGKGVIISDNKEEAFTALKKIFLDKEFGNSGDRIVIEEFIEGQEVSFIVISDGKNIIPLATAQDHKKRFDGDKGPNTGGMGTYSPVSLVTPQLNDKIIKEIIQPTINGLLQENIPFVGFLFAGLMIDTNGDPKVLEFNCRLGDPETQSIMMRLDSDLVQLIIDATNKKLDQSKIEWKNSTALSVVLVSEGYPGKYKSGITIEELPQDENDIKIFHAGTIEKDQKIVTSGGRIMCVSCLAKTIEDAQKKAYSFINKIHFPYIQYRTDIGYREAKS